MGDRDWEARGPLPRLDDLPSAPDGYDRQAVAAAFDAFYRHAAELDATLRALEALDAFAKQAGELRSDIRALRAASWGPLPGRQTWASGYAARAAAEPRGGFAELAPRLAVEAAFIVLVAVGAALADLEAQLVVLLVLGAWLVVGLAEVLFSAGRPAPRPPLFAPRPAEAQTAQPQPTEVVPTPVVEEPPPVPEPVAAAEPEPVPPEPERPVVLPPRRRFGLFGRRAGAEEPAGAPIAFEPVQPRHVRVLPPEPDAVEVDPEAGPGEAEPAAEALAADPWEQGADLPAPAEPIVVETAEPVVEPAFEPPPASAAAAEVVPEAEPEGAREEVAEAPEPIEETEPEPVADLASEQEPEPAAEEPTSEESRRRRRFWRREPKEAAEAAPAVESGSSALEPELTSLPEEVADMSPEPEPVAEVAAAPEDVAVPWDVSPEAVVAEEPPEPEPESAPEPEPAPESTAEVEPKPVEEAERELAAGPVSLGRSGAPPERYRRGRR